MPKARDKNFVSIWFWLLSMLVMAIPVVNIVMTLVWAFTGENEARKNYFKALILLFLLAIALIILLTMLGMIPAFLQHYRALSV